MRGPQNVAGVEDQVVVKEEREPESVYENEAGSTESD